MEEQTKRCPYCDEVIRLNAIKCKHCGSMLTDSASRAMFSDTVVRQALIARYEVLETLGRGGMGVVYKAIQKNLNRPVALKVLPQQLIHDEEFLKRFHGEARKAAQLNHPNIVVIYDEGVENSVHFIAMEFIAGEDLRKIIVNAGMLSVDQTLNWLTPVVGAVGFAHRHGIVHRDIKSANILINKEGQPKLTDFGIARIIGGEASMTRTPEMTQLTRAGMILGTLQYMSPEQVQGQPTDGRSDIYSLGVVMYQCLTGELPFRGDTDWSTMHKITNDVPTTPRSVRPDIPKVLEKLVLRCMSKHVNDRYQTCEELQEALLRVTKEPTTSKKKLPELPPLREETLYDSPTLVAPPESATTIPSPIPPKSIKWKTAAMGAVAVIVVATLVWKFILSHGANMGEGWEQLSDLDRKQIEMLFERAERLEQDQKIFEPAGNNAFDQYRDILKIHPHNRAALEGLDRLRKDLLKQAENFQEQKNFINAEKLVQTGLQFFANDADLQALSRQLEILRLVQLAKDYAGKQQYTAPLGQNAYDACKKILERDPQNQTATAILQEIETWFLVEGSKLVQQGRLRQAGEHYVLGKGLFPQNAEIAREADKLKEHLVINTKIKKLIEEAKTHLQNKEWERAWNKSMATLQEAPNEKQLRDLQEQVMKELAGEAAGQLQRKRYSQALEAYALIKRLNPAQNTAASEAAVHERWGDHFLEQNELDEAIKKYRTALSLNPSGTQLKEKLQNAEAKKEKSLGIDFVFVSGGSFQMGNTLDNGDDDEKPVHTVQIKDFYMSRYEITFAQYEVFCRETKKPVPPDNGWGRDNRPVINVNWEEAREFCVWFSRRTGMNVRLPTEAEWEYAARNRGESIKWAGTSLEAELEQYAWSIRNSGQQTHPVGQKKTNGLGLYDMSGNAYEWCADGYDKKFYQKSLGANPQAQARKEMVQRGGSAKDAAANLRCANRYACEAKSRNCDFPTGFRVVRSL